MTKQPNEFSLPKDKVSNENKVSGSQKALFLDRDGVINVDHGYVSQPNDFEFIDDVFDVCRWFQSQGFIIVVVTNQSGIGRGYYDEKTFWELTNWMVDEFKKQGVTISDVQFCPHHPTNALVPYKQDCDCRKPQPGMLLAAAEKLDIDMSLSVMVGDKGSDMKAARSANVQYKYLVESGQTFSDQDAKLADKVFANLTQLQQHFSQIISQRTA